MPTIGGTFTGNAQTVRQNLLPAPDRSAFRRSSVNLIALGIQFVTFAALWIYYRTFTDFSLNAVTPVLPAIGLLVLAQTQIMVLAMGVGCLLAAATGKYRDLQHVLPVLIQLWFYATPIVYPLSMISREANWRWVATINPMTAARGGHQARTARAKLLDTHALARRVGHDARTTAGRTVCVLPRGADRRGCSVSTTKKLNAES